jgi:putative transcriptional regulator
MAPRDPKLDALYPDLVEGDPADDAPMPTPRLRERVLASTNRGTRFEGFVARLAAFLDLGPEAARELLARVEHADEPPWVGGTAAPGGARILHFSGGPRLGAAHCGLVHLVPHTRFPHHRHLGDEWSFVLSGSAEDEGTGRVWAPGDLVHKPPGSSHALRVVGDLPFVFAVVLGAGIQIDERPS